jgi:hypothetical protein
MPTLFKSIINELGISHLMEVEDVETRTLDNVS